MLNFEIESDQIQKSLYIGFDGIHLASRHLFRVSEIQEWTANVSWRHVPTKCNPADLVSRGCGVNELRD